MKFVFIRSLFFLIVSFSFITRADDLDTVQGVLALSKFTGTCGILDSMISFQNATQMPGGDEFVSRFWTTEATRLGISMQQYIDRCNESVDMYNKIWKAAETKNQ